MTGIVTVIATPLVPEISFEGYVQGKGAASGADDAFLKCVKGFGDSSCSGKICGAVVVLMEK
jgi:hypothetical protein